MSNLTPFDQRALIAACTNSSDLPRVLLSEKLTPDVIAVMFNISVSNANVTIATLFEYLSHSLMTPAIVCGVCAGKFISLIERDVDTPHTTCITCDTHPSRIAIVLGILSETRGDYFTSEVAKFLMLIALEKNYAAGVDATLPYVNTDSLCAIQLGASYAEHRKLPLYERVLDALCEFGESREFD